MLRTELIRPLPELLAAHARQSGDKVAYRDAGRSVTYARLAERTGRIAGHLSALRLQPGDRAAILLGNRVEAVESCLAIARAAAIGVPLDPRTPDAELAHLLADSGARLVVTDPSQVERVRRLVGLGSPVRIVVTDHGTPPVGGACFETLAATEPAVPARDDLGLDEVAWLLYTSGTTGMPRGVRTTQRAALWTANASVVPIAGLHAEDRILWPLPLSHSLSHLVCVVAVTAVGASARLVDAAGRYEGPVVDRIASALREDATTLVGGPPALYRGLLAAPPRKGLRTLGPRVCLAVGSSVPDGVREGFEEAYGTTLLDVYGSAETCGALAMAWPSGDRADGSCGIPVPGVNVRLVDPATGEDVPAGAEGELLASGPNVMTGYHNDPAATEDALVDGWYRTGDLARRDLSGYLRVTGRLGEVVVRGGERVHPAEVEEVLRSVPGVADAAVVGRPHELLGEVPVAFVVPGPEGLDPALLRAACRERLTVAGMPEELYETETVPRTASGTIARHRLLTHPSRLRATAADHWSALLRLDWIPLPGGLGTGGPLADAGGSAGASGSAGPLGSTGTFGSTGPLDSAGPLGSTGMCGSTGPLGVTGTLGSAGPLDSAGPLGTTGMCGSTGPLSVTGTLPSTGPLGVTGPFGSARTPGAGAPGHTEAPGHAGESAVAGALGTTAAFGSAGTPDAGAPGFAEAPLVPAPPAHWLLSAPDAAGLSLALEERLAEGDAVPGTVVFGLEIPGAVAAAEFAGAVGRTVDELAGRIEEWLGDVRLAGARIAVATRGAVIAGSGEGLHNIAHAPVWGLLRSFQAAHPGRFLLLDLDQDPDSLAALPAALACGAPQLALRTGVPLVPRLTRVSADADPDGRRPFDPEGALVVTGAESPQAAALARHLTAGHGVRHVLLIASHDAADPRVTGLAGELTRLGAQVGATTCDLTDRSALAVALSRAGRQVTAVVHTDGWRTALAHRPDRPLAAAVAALLHLHELSRAHDPAAFVVCSSADTLLGAPGEGGRAAYDSFLDALARHRADRGLPGLSLGWGPWEPEAAGQGWELPVPETFGTEPGVGTLGTAEGLAMFDAALLGGPAHCLPLRLDTAALTDGRPVNPLLADLVDTSVLPGRRASDLITAEDDGVLGAAGLDAAGHPLLGALAELPADGGVIATGRLSLATHPWLAGHAVSGTVLLPSAALVELALRVGERAGTGSLDALLVETPLPLPASGAVRVHVTVGGPDADGRRPVTVHARDEDGGPWVRHATGRTSPAGTGPACPEPYDFGVWPPRGARTLPVEDFYDLRYAAGHEYGPVFRGLRTVWRRGEELFAEAALPEGAAPEAAAFGLHPALLDAALHTLAFAPRAGSEERTPLPCAWTGVTLHTGGAARLRVRIAPRGDGTVSVETADATGAPVATIAGLALGHPSPAPASAPASEPVLIEESHHG